MLGPPLLNLFCKLGFGAVFEGGEDLCVLLDGFLQDGLDAVGEGSQIFRGEWGDGQVLAFGEGDGLRVWRWGWREE